MPITVTFDLEDSRPSPRFPERFVDATHRFLEYLARRSARATFFVVGELAAAHPALVRDVAAAGHEVGLHGLRHVPLGSLDASTARVELARGRSLLQDLTGQAVNGFRAPIFSLTPRTAWAIPVIAELGFTYSSSVLPASNPLHGWPGAPRGPFRWEAGLVELPCPVLGVGRASVPFLGGIYLRYLPPAVSRRLARRAGVGAWAYLHPYDLDPDEAFFVMPHASWLTSRLLHANRRKTLQRLDSVLVAAGGPGPSLGEIADSLGENGLPAGPADA